MEQVAKKRRTPKCSPLDFLGREERLAAEFTRRQLLIWDKTPVTDDQLLEAVLWARSNNINGRTERVVQNYKRRLIAEELIGTLAHNELLHSLYDQEFPTEKPFDRHEDVLWQNRRKHEVLELRKYENGELLRIAEGDRPWSELSPLKRRPKTPQEVIMRYRNKKTA